MTLTLPWTLERDQLLPVRLVGEVRKCKAVRSSITSVEVDAIYALDSMGESISMTDDEATVAESVLACEAERVRFCSVCLREPAAKNSDECDECDECRFFRLTGCRFL